MKMSKLAPYLKAITAALVAGLSVILTALDQGGLHSRDYVSAAIAFLIALGAVYSVPNKPAN